MSTLLTRRAALVAGSLTVFGRASPAAPTPKPDLRPGRLLISRGDKSFLIDPDGRNEVPLASATNPDVNHRGRRFSPDGRRVAGALWFSPTRPPAPGAIPFRNFVMNPDKSDDRTLFTGPGSPVAWSPDGTELVLTDSRFKRGGHPYALDVTAELHNLKSGARVPLPGALQGCHVFDWSADGRHFLTVAEEGEGKTFTWRLHLVGRDGTPVRPLSRPNQFVNQARFSPDGTRVLFAAAELTETGIPKYPQGPLYLIGVEKPDPRLAPGTPVNAWTSGVAWSPDGKRFAYGSRPAPVLPKDFAPGDEDKFLAKAELTIVLSDIDGKQSATIATEKTEKPFGSFLSVFDWR